MKIGIEAQRIFRKRKHGMDVVILETMRRLQTMDHDNEYYIFVAPGEDHCLAETSNFHIIEVKCPSYPLWEQVALPSAASRYGVDLLHCTSNTAPLFMRGIPMVLTLHDIIFLEPRYGKNPSIHQNLGRIYRRLVVPRIIGKAAKIITVSNYERERILNHMHLSDAAQIVTIYNGLSDIFHPITDCGEVVSKYTRHERYIFMLGNSDPKKNMRGAIAAYGRYLERSSVKLPLVIADMSANVAELIIKEQKLDMGIMQHIDFVGYVPNTDLPYLYGDAGMCLFLSLRESFGLPIVESMACGTPVVVGNSSASPEIAGSGGVIADLGVIDDIVDKMLELESNADFHDRQVAYGLERAKCFSWENTAREVLDVYNNVLKK